MSITSAPGVGRLERVPIKEVWPHEEFNLTPWLQDNLEVLDDVIDVPITSAEREQAAGSFIADLVGLDKRGRRVIIENQFGKSNHDHLGKLITYMTAYEASVGIWIAQEARPEHVQSIVWLNQSTSASHEFYLVKIDAVRIGDSPPAPLLIKIVGPSAEAKIISAQKEVLDEKQETFRRFWTQHLERANKRTPFHVNISPSRDRWLSASAGKPGFAWGYSVWDNRARVELYIDRGTSNRNKAIFDQFHGARTEIEQTFGQPLEWERMDAKKASRIAAYIESCGFANESGWPHLQEQMIDAMIRLEIALRPHLDKQPK